MTHLLQLYLLPNDRMLPPWNISSNPHKPSSEGESWSLLLSPTINHVCVKTFPNSSERLFTTVRDFALLAWLLLWQMDDQENIKPLVGPQYNYTVLLTRMFTNLTLRNNLD